MSESAPHDPRKAYLTSGTVQPNLSRSEPFLHHAFGRAEYERDKPVVSDSIRAQAQPVIDRLNRGELSDAAAMVLLDKIWY